MDATEKLNEIFEDDDLPIQDKIEKAMEIAFEGLELIPKERSWELSKENCLKAMKKLGITHVVDVEVVNTRKFCGLSTLDLTELTSIVLISAELPTAKEASRTMWHELTHVRQLQDRGPRAHFDQYQQEMKDLGIKNVLKMDRASMEKYVNAPMEREAIQNMDLHDWLPLAYEKKETSDD